MRRHGDDCRTRRRDVGSACSIVGVSAQKLLHLDVLLISPWSVTLPMRAATQNVLIANPVSYLAQKLLINSMRKPGERAKDILYIHDTLSLFARSLPELHDLWINGVAVAIGSRTAAHVRRNRDRAFGPNVPSLAFSGAPCPPGIQRDRPAAALGLGGGHSRGQLRAGRPRAGGGERAVALHQQVGGDRGRLRLVQDAPAQLPRLVRPSQRRLVPVSSTSAPSACRRGWPRHPLQSGS